MKTRYIWTLERDGRETRRGLDTLDDLAVALMREDLPGVMPTDWIVATLRIDEDDAGIAEHVSPHGWSLRVRRLQHAADDHSSIS
ncbi:hypothetical protein [Rhizobium hainanense]|uniref:Uncharacterized protein n=1 Tax=Rhizobium hainanense TaxID=52131 RepID=A0A1C3WCA4_9HYPH|nr:hypothetical protein [Rhizobium hainanense]SCB37583.1 hypothetical protein GA0061100_11544 [Rhizobium hainanense]